MANIPLLDPALETLLLATREGLWAERETHLGEAARHAAEAEARGIRIDAIDVLLGRPTVGRAALSTKVDGTKEEAGPREIASWTDLVERELEGRNGGMTHQEFVAAAKGTVLEARYLQSPNAFYSRLSKLEKAKKVVRRGKVFYLPETIAKIESGEITEEPPRQHAQGGAIPDLIAKLLSERPGGMKAADVIEALKAMPEAQTRMTRNPQVAYSALSRMIQLGIVERDQEGEYFLHGKGPSLFSSEESPKV